MYYSPYTANRFPLILSYIHDNLKAGDCETNTAFHLSHMCTDTRAQTQVHARTHSFVEPLCCNKNPWLSAQHCENKLVQ